MATLSLRFFQTTNLRATLAALALACAFAPGCLREGADADAAPPSAEARGAPRPVASAERDERARMQQQIEHLRAELDARDTQLQAVALERAALTHQVDEAGERTTELSDRLRAATDAIGRLTAERKALDDALAEALARAQRTSDHPPEPVDAPQRPAASGQSAPPPPLPPPAPPPIAIAPGD